MNGLGTLYAIVLMWTGAGIIWLGSGIARDTGFTTPYSRCRCLVQQVEYQQALEPGASPSNPYLPPHLRLDQLSYLDLPTTELAVPPMHNMSRTPQQRHQAIMDVIREQEAEEQQRRAAAAQTGEQHSDTDKHAEQTSVLMRVARRIGSYCDDLGVVQVRSQIISTEDYERSFVRGLPLKKRVDVANNTTT